MHTAICDQKLQLGWQQLTHGRDDHFSGHVRARNEQRHAQTLTRTIIGDHQDSDPGAGERQVPDLRTKLLTLCAPLRILLLALLELASPLCAQLAPLLLLGLACPTSRRRRVWMLPRHALGSAPCL